MKDTKDIVHNEKALSDILAAHRKFTCGEDGGERADLGGANLRGADLGWANLRGANLGGAYLREGDLGGAYLRGADLGGATGNMSEVKSMQIETWPITYTADILQIGCQRHPIDVWRKSDPRWIAAIDKDATEWWGKFGALILQIIDASPSTPSAAVTA